MSEDLKHSTLYCATFLAFTIILCVTFIGGCKAVEETNQAAIKAGLSQKSNPPSGPIWVKPAKEGDL